MQEVLVDWSKLHNEQIHDMFCHQMLVQ